jgi:ubiquinone/menaquinone biosynthesis C-methylase UbiE
MKKVFMSCVSLEEGSLVTPIVRIVVILALLVIVALGGYALAWLLLIYAGNRLTKRQLALQPGMHVLDVGCGSGRVTIPMAQQVGSTGSVLGIDIDAGKIQRAQQRLEETSITNVHFERAGAGEGKLPHDQFDRALLFAVLGEMADRKAALAEIFQALKSGGILCITEGFLDPHYQSQERVRSLAQAVGFVEERCAGNRWLFTMNFLKPAASSVREP